MTMKGIPRRLSAWNRLRSAGVSAKSSTAKTQAKSLDGTEPETTQRVIDIARVDAGMGARDPVRTSPQRFGVHGPGALFVSEMVQ
jgi:hypothetical protein